jgi:molybdopterin-guanine dinucleotide biosynthesis protein A
MAPWSSGVTGILLVGGGSSRFGSPKALARLEGETLAERAWRALEWCDERHAVGKAVDGLPLPFPVHDDGSPVRAPLAGVVAGLRLASGDVCVVLPVDCPRVTPALLQDLARACRDAAVPQTGPLPGAYRRGALPVLERRLAADALSLRDALRELDVRTLELDAALLVDVDTPEELDDLTRPARPASE